MNIVGTLNSGGNAGGFRTEPGEHLICGALTPGAHPGSYNGQDAYTGHLIAHTLRAEGFDASEDGTGRGTPIVPVAFQERGRPGGRTVETQEDLAYALLAPNGGGRRQENCIAFAQNQRDEVRVLPGVAGALAAEPGMKQQTYVMSQQMAVRRLTPRECERLQGFPDDWTRFAADGSEISNSARYRMLGNAVNVKCSEWIGRRVMESACCK